MKKIHVWAFRGFLGGNEASLAFDYAILIGIVAVANVVVLSALSGNLDKIVSAFGG